MRPVIVSLVQVLWSKQGLTALIAFVVWFTIIFARTDGFDAFGGDSRSIMAILGSAASMAVFGSSVGYMLRRHHYAKNEKWIEARHHVVLRADDIDRGAIS